MKKDQPIMGMALQGYRRGEKTPCGESYVFGTPMRRMGSKVGKETFKIREGSTHSGTPMTQLGNY